MPKVGRVHREKKYASDVDSEWMRKSLHDLCQPMMALECGLYVGTMSPDGVRAPRADELLETILTALQQCELACDGLRAIQKRMSGHKPQAN